MQPIVDIAPAPPEPQNYRFEGYASRMVTLTGVLLARESSKRWKPRWSDVELYRSITNLYVYHSIGRTIVFHGPDCVDAKRNRLPYGHELPGGMRAADLASWCPCDTCKPLHTDPPETLRYERDRHRHWTVESAQAAVDQLYASGNWVDVDLLKAAAKLDDDLRVAYAADIEL